MPANYIFIAHLLELLHLLQLFKPVIVLFLLLLVTIPFYLTLPVLLAKHRIQFVLVELTDKSRICLPKIPRYEYSSSCKESVGCWDII